MAKAKLATLTEKWINGKTEKQHTVKIERQKSVNEERIKQTLYMSKQAAKLLWYNRAETGETMSHALERLVIEGLGKGKKKK